MTTVSKDTLGRSYLNILLAEDVQVRAITVFEFKLGSCVFLCDLFEENSASPQAVTNDRRTSLSFGP